MHNVITEAKLCKERIDEEQSRIKQTPWRGAEDVPVPYGKSHSLTATLLGHRVKGAALAEVHHPPFQPQFEALQCF